MNNCIKCGDSIPKKSKSKKYCSPRCSKLFLQSLYRKRKRKQLNEYKRQYRKQGKRISGYYEKVLRPRHINKQPFCQKCGSKEDLHVAHVKPRNKGGDHNSLITLCRKHHHELDELLRSFWS